MTEKPIPSCNVSLLDALVEGTLDDAGSKRLTEHLDRCDHCRSELDARSANLNSETSELLRVQPFDAESSLDQIDTDDLQVYTDTQPQHPLMVRSVLDSLAPTDDPSMLGRMGGYEVSGVVGAGGMGVVLKAFDRSLDRMVAIKVLAPHLACSGAARQRFAREAKAAAAVLHPNVVAIHGVSTGEDESMLPYLVMPYVRGTSLQARIDVEGALALTEILRISSQVVEGLSAAHSQGLVHRDIKPANILLEESVERVSITDFGLARAVDDATVTRSGVIAGTPQYMSPEQARGEPIDPRSDLFSLGSVIYTMCTGRAPFRAETSYGILRRITDEDPRPIREINPDIPGWLCRFVDRLLEKAPENRYQSANAVAQVLQQCLMHVQTPDARLPRELRRSIVPEQLKQKAVPLALVAIVALLLILPAVFPNGTRPSSETSRESETPAQTSAPDQPDSDQPKASATDARDPSSPEATSSDLNWSDSDEPSIESVRLLIQLLDQETRRSFEESPN